MARKDDLKLLFNFMIELLKEEEENKNVVEVKTDKKVLVEETKPKTTNFGTFDPSRIKTIMDKMEAKGHEDAVVKHALNVQAKDYKKEIEELREQFNQKVLKENKLEDESAHIQTTRPITGETMSRG